MSISNSRTDRELSIDAKEFVWDNADESEAHEFLVGPILRLLASAKARSVLDLGCGNGSFTMKIASQNYDITGCDFSQSGIELAQRQFPEVKFFQQDVSQDLSPEHAGKYDAVISTEVIEHLLLPRKLMENARNALKPRGILILSTPYHGYLKNLALALTDNFDKHWHPLRDYGHIKFFSRATLMQMFKEHKFEQIHFETVGRIPVFARSMIVSGIKP